MRLDESPADEFWPGPEELCQDFDECQPYPDELELLDDNILNGMRTWARQVGKSIAAGGVDVRRPSSVGYHGPARYEYEVEDEYSYEKSPRGEYIMERAHQNHLHVHMERIDDCDDPDYARYRPVYHMDLASDPIPLKPQIYGARVEYYPHRGNR